MFRPPSPPPSDDRPGSRWGVPVPPPAIIFVCAAGLAILGLTILFSASVSFNQGPYFYLKKQLGWLVLSGVFCFAMSRIDIEYLRRQVWVIVAVALAGLVLVRIPHVGIMVNGSRRWLGYGPVRLQISEFAKLALVFGLAHYLALNQTRISEFKHGFLYPALGIMLFTGLVVIEPDLGTAALMGVMGFLLLFLAGARLRYLLPMLPLAAGGFAVMVWVIPNRLARFLAFLDVEGNRDHLSYQLWQAWLALAAGGMDGVGLGQGRQQIHFLPEAHTDFIFAVIGEELGLRFTLLVVLLFAIIFAAGIIHLRKAPNLFQYLLVAGCLLLICLQAIINLGVVTGLLPTKGMSLPFISAGGSNLLLMGLLLGIILNTQRSWTRPVLMKRARALKEVLV